jgi:hypothetical protein
MPVLCHLTSDQVFLVLRFSTSSRRPRDRILSISSHALCALPLPVYHLSSTSFPANMSALGRVPSLAPSITRSDSVHSSASSGQKRRRDGSPAQSTSFLQTAKNLVSQRTNTSVCWNCEAPHTELCHVVAKADPAVSSNRRSWSFC